MRQQNQNASTQGSSFSNNTLLYTIYRHHHGLSHEQAMMKIEATMMRTLETRNGN